MVLCMSAKAAAVLAETERCAKIAEKERDGWKYFTSGYTAANTIYRKIRGELPDELVNKSLNYERMK